MKKFNIDNAILPETHYHIDFTYQIQAILKAEKAEKPTTVLFPPKTGKSTLLENYYQEKLQDATTTPIYLNFEPYTRTDFSTMPKFFARLKKDLVDNGYKTNNQIRKVADNFEPEDMGSFCLQLEEFLNSMENKKILIIEDLDKALENDTVAVFIGYILKLFEARTDKIKNSFDFILLSASKKINNFKPAERGLDDPDYFCTWSHELTYSDCIKPDENNIKTYTQNYCDSIQFQMEDNVPEELLSSSNGKLVNINKLLKFYDEKVRIYKKQKVLTAAEVKHAAGYVMVKGPF